MGEVVPATAPAPASLRLLGLDWGQVLPWRFEDVIVRHGTFEGDAEPFIAKHYAAIFGTPDVSARFLVEPMTEAKRRFCREMDIFVFEADGATVGIHMSHPSDWSTYYQRSTALLPAYRGRKLVQRLLAKMEGPLRDAGVTRLEGDVSPTNTPMVRLNLEAGYVVTATTTSERWGMVLRFTRFLREEAEDVFNRQFCAMAVKPPKYETSNTRRTP